MTKEQVLSRGAQILADFSELTPSQLGYINDMKGGEWGKGFRDGHDSGWWSCHDDCSYLINELVRLIADWEDEEF
jgi:hypothetical protein